MSAHREDPPRGYASPPCSAHELEASAAMPATERAEIMRWRKAERERLIVERLAIPSRVQREYSDRIARHLEDVIGDARGLTVSTYAPFRAEPGLAGLMERIVERGGRTALPVVIARGTPLVFRIWKRGDPLERGIWNIPQPPAAAEAVLPDVVIAPIVGFDSECYRLGYGGGFFDRTLAAMSKRPRVFGVGYAQARIPTIFPLPHDVPMSAIVTEEGLVERR